MSRNPQIDRLIAIIEPVCMDVGCELVDVRLLMEQGGWVLRVCVDRPLHEGVDLSQPQEDRVDLSECENISRLLSAALDVDDPIPQAYSLEVSSPGIERPLRTATHFRLFAGAEVKIQMAVPVIVPSTAPAGNTGVTSTNERRNFRGVLAGVHGAPPNEMVMIDVDGKRFELPLGDIDSTRIVPDWDDVMNGGSGISRPNAKAKGGKSKPKPSKDAAAKPSKHGGAKAEPSASSSTAQDASLESSPDVPSPDHRPTES